MGTLLGHRTCRGITVVYLLLGTIVVLPLTIAISHPTESRRLRWLVNHVYVQLTDSLS